MMTSEQLTELGVAAASIYWTPLEDMEQDEACRLACAYFELREEDDSWDFMTYAQTQWVQSERCDLQLTDTSATLTCDGTLFTDDRPSECGGA